MSEHTSSRKYIQPVLGLFLAINLLLSAFLMVKVQRVPRIGYVNMEKVTFAWLIDINKQATAPLQPRMDAWNEKMEEYKKEENKFETTKEKKTSYQRRKIKQKLEKKLEGIKKEEQDINNALAKLFMQEQSKRGQEMIEGIEKVRKAHQYDLFIKGDESLFSIGDSGIDATQQVLDEIGLEEPSQEELRYMRQSMQKVRQQQS